MRPMSAAFSVLALTSTLVATAAIAASLSDDVIRQKIVGSWGYLADCRDGKLIFNADGTFVLNMPGTSDTKRGTYAIADGKLTGKVDGDDMPEADVGFDKDDLYIESAKDDPNIFIRCAMQ